MAPAVHWVYKAAGYQVVVVTYSYLPPVLFVMLHESGHLSKARQPKAVNILMSELHIQTIIHLGVVV
jgi:hypothetical protein